MPTLTDDDIGWERELWLKTQNTFNQLTGIELDAPPTVTQLEDSFEEYDTANQALKDEKLIRFRKGINAVAAKLQMMLMSQEQGVQAGSEEDLSALRQTVHLQRQIRGQLTLAGYDALATRFQTDMDEDYILGDQVVAKLGAYQQLVDLPGPIQGYTGGVIQNLRDFNLQSFDHLGNKATERISREIILNTLAGKPKEFVIRDLENYIPNALDYDATTVARSALASFDRVSTMQIWMNGGFTQFRYSGPKDSRNREFCWSRVGNIYSMSEIKKWDNGTSYPVWPFLGGPQCRHTLVPVFKGDTDRGRPNTKKPDKPGPRPPVKPLLLATGVIVLGLLYVTFNAKAAKLALPAAGKLSKAIVKAVVKA